MKSPSLRLFAILTAAGMLSASMLLAQQGEKKKPETWEEKKAAILKPLTDDQKHAILEAIPSEPTAKPQKERRILVFYRCEGFVHASIEAGNHCLQRMGEKTGAFQTDIADDYSVFTPENLAKYDAIVFNNTTHLAFPDHAQEGAILDFIKSGKGIVGIHAASDNFYEWAEGAALMGGQFTGHPWTSKGTYAFKLDDPKHTLNAVFGGKGFWHKDEIYWYKPETYVGPEKLRILVSLDMSKPETRAVFDNPKFADNKPENLEALQVPVSWLRAYGEGRLFYTNLGHNPDTFWNPKVVRHYLDGIQYALGDLEADATPTAEIEKMEPALAEDKGS